VCLWGGTIQVGLSWRSQQNAGSLDGRRGAMRSTLRFVMHPEDEQSVVAELFRDPSVVLVDGPRWKSSKPNTTRELASVGNYCIIWSPDDLPELEARFVPTCNDWYCESEHSTIQFLRSSLHGSVLTDGRLAISTEGATTHAGSGVERRFKRLRKFVKKTFANSVVCWQNMNTPATPASPSNSANPSKPDTSFWVGPVAMTWLRADPCRCVKVAAASPVEGRLLAPSDNPLARLP